MYLVVNIIGLIVFLAIGLIFSKDRKNINWKSVAIMVVFNLVLAWFLTSFSIGRDIVAGAAAGFNALVEVSFEGIKFALPNWMPDNQPINFVAAALLPILMIVPMFDILTYIGVLPWIIKWIGFGLSKLTGQPKFESFFAVEMMFLGNTEALAISGLQLRQMSAKRNVTLAMMSMSCITASILGAYTQMMPADLILTAVPINIINALIVTSMLNPVKVAPEDDVIVTMGGSAQNEAEANIEENAKRFAPGAEMPAKPAREPFFSFLGNSILGSGKLILIIVANVIAFVSLAALINKLLGMIWSPLSLESILGVFLFPFAWLTGLPVHDAFKFAQYMGMKLVTNEFVVMGMVKDTIRTAAFSNHYRAVLTVFITSFANFSTLGMIIGCFKGLVDDEKNNEISRNVGYMLLSGVLVSLLSAATVGLFVW
ncbi:NupC/NupG family nucleoside CNT transporter [Ligilactobacillus ceti]|nr:nucleoside transporter C-terminal domain-containing protein [Ligilactobacillus ceti]